jgi:subtilisin family serine protease
MSRSASIGSAAAIAAAVVLCLPSAATAAPGPDNAPEYWFDQWGVTQLWQGGARGQGITIAEIDTGVNASLPELAGNVLVGTDFGQPGDGRTDREINEFGHGTAMASIMVAHVGILGITGIAPDAKILPIAVPLTGTTDAGGDDHLADAIRYAVDHGSKIISMSLGGTRKPARDSVPCPDAEQDAIYYALNKGVVMLASSGNTGLTGSAVEEPGVCLGVISVGAVDQNNVAANFSARHPYLTLTAPGVNVPSLSRVRGAAYAGDGTSQATAVASAALALVWSKFPTQSGRQIVARVLATLDRHSTTRDPAYGYGVINPQRAITAKVSASAPNPVYANADPFVARYITFSQASAIAPPPPASAVGHTGSVSVGHSPRLSTPRVREGLTVALGGLIALVVLGIIAVLRRRRARRASDPSATTFGEAAQPRAPYTDESGVVWHEIIDPQTESDSFL